MIKEEPKYEEWLTTIINTRLLYNTMEEIESVMDNQSIHSNGIKRYLSTMQKMRSAYRDLKIETHLMTDGAFYLDDILIQYKKAWEFFKKHLSRRANPKKIAEQLLRFYYYPYTKDGLEKKLALFEQVKEQEIEVPFLILMLLDIIPGYNSKGGNVYNMPSLYEQAMQLLESFTSDYSIMDDFPVIKKARDENNKTRLMLLFHVYEILNTYESYTTSQNIYDTADFFKSKMLNLDIEGYWNECGGTNSSTHFWQIESADNTGTYFATHWHKSADNTLTGIKYTIAIHEADDGNVIVYFQHPENIKNRIKGKKYTDHDHTWYKMPMPESTAPDSLPLVRAIKSSEWKAKIDLTRVTDDTVIDQYRKWEDTCEKVKRFADCDYNFNIDMYAITQTHIYIPANTRQFYKIPKDACDGFEYIKFGDNVGTMTMNHKVYLAFDDFLLYIQTDKKHLEKYGITIVDHID